ncbi:MAG: chemotaxis protein CheA [Spirochaetaceae bacterium]|nr:chemotaxis protein CheA [Spirochaetaceae bacterium]
MSDYLDPNNEELLKDFFAEAEQQVEQLESNILVIESDPSNKDAIDEIFRAAHTLKGGSATVEMMELSHFTHSVEDVLDEIRSDKLKIDEEVVDLLLTSIDVIKAMLEERRNGSVYEENIDIILNKLNSYLNKTEKQTTSINKGSVSSTKKPVVFESAVSAPKSTSSSGLKYPELTEEDFAELKTACEANQKLWCVGVKFDEENPMNSVGGIQVFAALKTVANVLRTIPDFDALYEDQFYENVFYYIATQATADEIEDVAFLSDVTLITDAQELTEESILNIATVQVPVQQPTIVQKKEKPEVSNQTKIENINTQIIQNSLSNSEENVTKKSGQKKESSNHSQNAILRVDAKRVDNLLNLVSEAVIIKATFNQLALQFTNNASMFQNSEVEFKDKLHSLFEKLPSYFEKMQNGTSANEIKKEILKEYGSLSSIFDAYETEQKNILTKFRSNTQNLGAISGELQEGVMKIRMVPINQIFSRFPRVVRDLQKDLNKKINLVIEGEDTELDKSVVEDLLDPIMHCVRNSVDHGIELPSERIAAGKPETGTILLRASNEGNMIVIEIKDDGKGIDVEKIRAKAVERGLIHPNKNINEQDAFQLIMQPGFSTAEKISNISGRGVGLDVVKTMITNLKGSISVSSVKGSGTTFTIKIPLTLAIIQGLLVRVGKEIYSIPISNVIESQCIRMDEISFLDNYEIMNLRNEVISVLRLSRLFNIKDSVQSDECYIVIVGTQEKKIGVMVDSLIGEEDVVIKPLRDQFTNSPGIAGASILGDGSVSLIIDVSQLLELGVKQELLSKHNEQQL